MAGKSRFGPELSKAEIDASVQELFEPGVLNKTIIPLASLVIYHFISSASS